MRFGTSKMVSAVLLSMLSIAALHADDKSFHDAPVSAKAQKNPFAGQQAAADAGKTLYSRNCLACHGKALQGTGNVPSLVDGKLKGVTAGEVFWFVTKGDKDNGMPSWAFLPEDKRWQIVTYVEEMASAKPAAGPTSAPVAEATGTKVKGAPPIPPFTDFRYEKPGTTHKITVKDLPQPYATDSAQNGAQLVARPEKVWPVAPAGFKVELFAEGLENPRLLRTAPNGDIFLAESEPGRIRVFRGMTGDGKPEQMQVFASGLKRPYGIAFYPPGPDPQWIYVGDTNEVIRFPYHNGDLKASGDSQHIADLPSGGGHWTRALDFSADGKRMFVAVGSASNVDDPDTHPGRERSCRHSGVRSGQLPVEGLCLRNSQCWRRDRGESSDWRVVVLDERTRRAGRQSGARLHHACRGRWILWLAVVVHRGASGSAASGEASGAEKQGDCAGRAVAAAQCLPGIHVLSEQTSFPQNIKETFSLQSTGHGTKQCAWVMR